MGNKLTQTDIDNLLQTTPNQQFEMCSVCCMIEVQGSMSIKQQDIINPKSEMNVDLICDDCKNNVKLN